MEEIQLSSDSGTWEESAVNNESKEKLRRMGRTPVESSIVIEQLRGSTETTDEAVEQASVPPTHTQLTTNWHKQFAREI